MGVGSEGPCRDLSPFTIPGSKQSRLQPTALQGDDSSGGTGHGLGSRDLCGVCVIWRGHQGCVHRAPGPRQTLCGQQYSLTPVESVPLRLGPGPCCDLAPTICGMVSGSLPPTQVKLQ